MARSTSLLSLAATSFLVFAGAASAADDPAQSFTSRLASSAAAPSIAPAP